MLTSNQIELIFRNQGTERGTKEVMHLLAEQAQDHERILKELAQSIAQMASVVTMQNTVMDAMKDVIDRNKKQDDDPESTRGLIS